MLEVGAFVAKAKAGFDQVGLGAFVSLHPWILAPYLIRCNHAGKFAGEKHR